MSIDGPKIYPPWTLFIFNYLRLTMWKYYEKINCMNRFEDIWQRLLEEVKKLGWGGNKLIAQRLGRKEAWVSKKLNQKRGVSLKDFIDICEALKINPGTLFEPCIKEYKTAEDFLRHLVREEVNRANPPEEEIKNGPEK